MRPRRFVPAYPAGGRARAEIPLGQPIFRSRSSCRSIGADQESDGRSHNKTPRLAQRHRDVGFFPLVTGNQMKTPPTTEVADGVLHAFASEEARHLLFKRALPRAVPGINIIFSRSRTAIIASTLPIAAGFTSLPASMNKRVRYRNLGSLSSLSYCSSRALRETQDIPCGRALRLLHVRSRLFDAHLLRVRFRLFDAAVVLGVFLPVDRCDMRRVPAEIWAPDSELLPMSINPLPELFG
jgi:hypothetical protein